MGQMGLAGVGRGGFLPTDLPNLELWLDAADIASLFTDAAMTAQVTAENDPVRGWKDKSGNSRHASRSGSTLLYKENVANGRPGVLFDGTANGYMDFPGSGWVPSGTNLTIIAVVGLDAAGGLSTVIGAATDGRSFKFTAAHKAALDKANTANVGTATNASSTSAASLNIVTYDGTNYAFYLNGTANGSGSSAQSFSANTKRLGTNDTIAEIFTGLIHEVVVYSRVLSAAELANF